MMKRVLYILWVLLGVTLLNANGNHEPDFADWDVSTKSQIHSHEMRIAYKGDIKLSSDLSSIRYISRDAVIYIAEVEGFSRIEILVKATSDNEYDMDVWVNGNRVNVLARQEENISRLIHLAATEYGLGGIHHMDDLYKSDGMEEVVIYLNQIHTGSILVYLIKGLMNMDILNRADEITLINTTDLIKSSSKLRDMLLYMDNQFPEDDEYSMALMEVAGQISSSSNMRDVLITLTKRLTDNPEVVSAFFDSTSKNSSSSNKRDILLKVIKYMPNVEYLYSAHLSATTTISSSSDKRDVLLQLSRSKLPIESYKELLHVISLIPSSSDQRDVLMQVARSGLPEECYEEFFDVTSMGSSSSNKRDVLMVAAKECVINDKNIVPFLNSAITITSSSDLRDVMMVLLKSHKLSPKSLIEYFKAAKHITSKSSRTDVVELGVQFMKRSGEEYTGNSELNMAAGDAMLGLL